MHALHRADARERRRLSSISLRLMSEQPSFPFSSLTYIHTLMPGTECLDELVSRVDGRTGWDRIAGPLHGSISRFFGVDFSALAVQVAAARRKPWKKPKEKWGLELQGRNAGQQRKWQAESGRWWGIATAADLAKHSRLSSNPAHSQSGISHPCDQNVATTCATLRTSRAWCLQEIQIRLC